MLIESNETEVQLLNARIVVPTWIEWQNVPTSTC